MKLNLMRTGVLHLLSAWGLVSPCLAQSPSASDADSTLLQQPPALRLPRTAPSVRVEVATPAATLPGGPRVSISAIRFSGATVFTQTELSAALGDVLGQAFDLAGLRRLADQITALYRDKGYPFASAVIPAQTMAEGALRIEVTEGRYGVVRATGEAALSAQTQAFLTELRPGQVIDTVSLERALLVLDDLPGLRVSPVIRPGQAVGTGDLDVVVERGAPYRGSVTVDNHGNRYTGRVRASAALDVNSALMLGDQISTRLQRTDRSLWFGHLGYSLPLGGSGLRAEVSAARMAYTLGGEFATLGASGTANVASLSLSFPLLRSQTANLGLAAGWQHRGLQDRQSQAGAPTDKTSRSLPLTLSFDWRDRLGGGGVNYGSLVHTVGSLRMDNTAATIDALTARSAGTYAKTSLSVARLQTLTPTWSLLGKASVQWAQQNLDASEKLSLGGASSVRAAPSGDASGDRGWLTQWELRYAHGAWAPYAFADAGQITTNARPWLAGPRTERRAGAGVGTRYSRGPLFCDATLAWRDSSRAPASNPQSGRVQAWLSVGTSF